MIKPVLNEWWKFGNQPDEKMVAKDFQGIFSGMLPKGYTFLVEIFGGAFQDCHWLAAARGFHIP